MFNALYKDYINGDWRHKEMKVGILTFHYAHNFGACLQAFALKEYFNSLGHSAIIVNYKNPKIHNLYPRKLKVHFLLYDFKHPKELGKKIKLLRDYSYGKKEWKKQYQKFEYFIDTYLLNNSISEVSFQELQSLDVDLFVGGSDQIWNRQLTGGFDRAYLLDFDTKARKAFYAASAGKNELDEEELPFFNKIFENKETFISARESSLASYLSNKYKRDVPNVIDPCFLLSDSDYVRLFNLNKSLSSKKKKYLFAYFISEKNKRIREMVRVIANALNLEIVEFHYRKSRDLDKNYQTSKIGPIEFLEYMYNADFIVTNSFHGTVFSLIFKKQFYSIYDLDARKDDLLNKFGLSDRHIKEFKDIDLNKIIDFSGVDIDNYSSRSKAFIHNMIKGQKND